MRTLKFVLKAIAAVLLGLMVVATGFRIAAFVRETNTAAELAPNTGRFVDAAGLKLFVQEAGPANGPAVVFIPGTMAWSETWRDAMAAVAAEGFHAVAIDLPPFGFSERPGEDGYGPKNQASRIIGVLDALGIEKTILVGHSFGGGATVETAFLNPERIGALVLVDVALGLDQAGGGGGIVTWALGIPILRNALTSATFTNSLLTGFGLRQFIADDSKADDARLAVYKRPLGVENTTNAVGQWLAADLFGNHQGAAFRDRARYASFASPVLIVWGRLDSVTPLAQGEAIAKLFAGSRLVVLEGVNHIPHLEDAAGFNATLTAYLLEHRPK